MPIIRALRPSRDFTVVRNEIINDGRLSLEARFILIYLISKPDNWSVSAQDLINLSRASARPSGKASIYAALKELTGSGYMVKKHLAAGGVEYTVYDTPCASGSVADSPAGATQSLASQPLPEMRQVGREPLSEKPLSEKPLAAFRTLVKTEKAVKTETSPRTEISVDIEKNGVVPADDIATIFEYWRTCMQSPRSRLDDKRRRWIKQALKMGYSPRDLCKAIRGCSKTPHNMGKNDRGEKYNGIDLIFRAADQIDRFIRNDDEPPKPTPARGANGIDAWWASDGAMKAKCLELGIQTARAGEYPKDVKARIQAAIAAKEGRSA